ncbi:hypothetical protein BSKO_10718 [Bryopsis sp. KO-2023]|nr:hypothetical protein BSKO_10718 [Bryopsis sp. KO-2023]
MSRARNVNGGGAGDALIDVDDRSPLKVDLENGGPSRVASASADSPWMKRGITIVACVAWMMVSSGLILLNKHLMSDLKFEYPMTLSGSGMLFSSVASYIACRVLSIVEERATNKDGSSIITLRFYLLRVMPVGFFMAATLYFGNMVYLYLTVSFIQILKSFTPVITMIFMFVFRLESPNSKLIWSVLIIAFGTAIASYGEINFSIVGVTVMLLSEAFESIRLVLTQLVLVGLKFHPIEGLMYFAPACVLWLAIGAVLVEFQPMVASGAFSIIADSPVKFLFAAAMGFSVNALSYCVIVLASSLTLKVLGTVKNALLVLAGVIFLGDLVTPLQGFGYVGSLIGFVMYNSIKMSDKK